MNEPRVLIVVATLGQRPEYLSQTLDSIRSQAVPSDVLMVAPLDSRTVQEAAQKYAVAVLPDPGSLPGAINLGAQQLKSHHEYFNWLNDDDLLEPGSLAATVAAKPEGAVNIAPAVSAEAKPAAVELMPFCASNSFSLSKARSTLMRAAFSFRPRVSPTSFKLRCSKYRSTTTVLSLSSSSCMASSSTGLT